MDYEVYVKIIIESKQFMNFNNEISLLSIEWLAVTGIHRGKREIIMDDKKYLLQTCKHCGNKGLLKRVADYKQHFNQCSFLIRKLGNGLGMQLKLEFVPMPTKNKM